jgi:predicted RNA-binding protein associated with RNAse of E/G family
VRGDEPFDKVWEWTHVLRLGRRDRPHSLDLFWDEAWAFLGWYVNLQRPLEDTRLGFDTTDWALDVVVDPDGSWRWKDEDDFAQAQELGVLDADDAAGVRAEGERVVAERPWPTGWEDWRPPAAWTPAALPEGWDVV